jgi:hypothetical protein
MTNRMPLLAFVMLAAVGGACVTRGTPLWWLGASCWVGAAVVAWLVYRPWLSQAHAALATPRKVFGWSVVPSARLLDLLYLGVLLWVATYMMRDALAGVRPVSHDHTVHFVKAWQLHEDFLSQGRLHGWSHRWFAGYPVNYLYPIGTDLFVNVVYYLSFGWLSMEAAYGVAFWLAHVLTGYSGYRFGKVVGGPHVGFITGFLLLTDMSAFRFGGWVYSIEYGVWPQALSLSLALLATARVPGIYEQRRLRDLGIFALYMGASIVTHPIELIYMAILLAVASLASAFSRDTKAVAGSLRLLLALGLSALVSAAWLLPFMSTRDHVTPMGVWWDSTYEMGKGLLSLTAFPGTIGFVLAFGVLGALVMLRSGRFPLMFTALMALVIPAVSSSTFIDEQHLQHVSRSLAKIQWLRMATMAKPFWFTLASYFAVVLVQKAALLARTSRDEAPESRSVLRDTVLAMVLSYLTLPIVVPLCQAYFTANVDKALQTQGDRRFDADRQALVDWLQKNLPSGDGFYRLCVNMGHNHELMDIATQVKVPVFKRGFTPAENYIYKVNLEDPAVMKAVNVRFMVAKKPMPEEDYEELTRFGVYRVFRFKHWSPRPYVITQGQGEVKVERFGRDEIVLRAAAGATGKLRLNVSHFPRWRATLDGKPIGIWPTALPEAPRSTGFMTVMLHPGEYRFVFERSLLDRASMYATLLGLVLVLGLLLADSAPRRLGWLASSVAMVTELAGDWSSPAFTRARRVLFALAAGGFVVGTVYLSEWQPKLALEELDGIVVKDVKFDFLENLGDARAHIEYPSVARRCKRFVDRFICRKPDGNLDNEKYIASTPAEIEEYRMVRCIRARPEEDARVVIDYGRVPTADSIVGYYGIERAGRLMRLTRPVDFKVYVDGKALYTGSTASDNKMHWFRAQVPGPRRDANVSFVVSSSNVSKRFFCFYAQMADVEQGPVVPPSSMPRRFAEDEDDERE